MNVKLSSAINTDERVTDTPLLQARASGLWRTHALVCVCLIGLCLIVYSHVYGLGFINDYDDSQYVTQNMQVRSGLSWANLVWAFKAFTGNNWHPLTLLSHMADCQFFGLNSAAHHVTSLAIHLANVILLYWVLHFATGAIWRSAFVAAFFGVHPQNVESVAWIAERKSVLSTLFFLLTLLAYVWYARSPNWKRYLSVAGLFILGLMAKPMLVTLPFVLLLLDYWPLERWSHTRNSGARKLASGSDIGVGNGNPGRNQTIVRLVAEKAPLFIFALIDSILTVRAQGTAVVSAKAVPLGNRVTNAVISYVQYLEKMAWPKALAVFYPHPNSMGPLWRIALASLLVMGITAAVLFAARWFKFPLVGWLWYLGTLIPVIGIVQVGGQARADRYAYIPLIGIFIVLVWGGAEVSQRLRVLRSGVIAVGVCVALVWALVARRQVTYWRDPITLFEHAEEVTGPNYVASANLAHDFLMTGDIDRALSEYAKAAAADPSSAALHHSVGMVLRKTGQTNQAIKELTAAVDLDPKSFDFLNDLGITLAESGHLDEAIASFNKVLELKPGYPYAYANLGNASETKGDIRAALAYYEKAIDLIEADKPVSNASPDFDAEVTAGSETALAMRVHLRISDILNQLGDPIGARSHYIEAQRLSQSQSASAQGSGNTSK